MLCRGGCLGGSWLLVRLWGGLVQNLQRPFARLGHLEDPTRGCCGSHGAQHWVHGVVNCASDCFSLAAQWVTKALLAREFTSGNSLETKRCACVCDCAAVTTPWQLPLDLQQGHPSQAVGGAVRSEGARCHGPICSGSTGHAQNHPSVFPNGFFCAGCAWFVSCRSAAALASTSVGSPWDWALRPAKPPRCVRAFCQGLRIGCFLEAGLVLVSALGSQDFFIPQGGAECFCTSPL